MEIYLVRHGETVWNAEQRMQGSADVELNAAGRELAGITGRALEEVQFDAIFSSPLIRAYETACLIRGHRNIPIIRDARIREMCFGVAEGRDCRELLAPDNDFRHFFRNPELYITPEGGESFDEVKTRAAEFLRAVIMPLEGQAERVLIVAHGAINHGMISFIENRPIEDYWKGGLQKNCGVNVYELKGGSFCTVEVGRIYY